VYVGDNGHDMRKFEPVTSPVYGIGVVTSLQRLQVECWLGTNLEGFGRGLSEGGIHIGDEFRTFFCGLILVFF